MAKKSLDKNFKEQIIHTLQELEYNGGKVCPSIFQDYQHKGMSLFTIVPPLITCPVDCLPDQHHDMGTAIYLSVEKG